MFFDESIVCIRINVFIKFTYDRSKKCSQYHLVHFRLTFGSLPVHFWWTVDSVVVKVSSNSFEQHNWLTFSSSNLLDMQEYYRCTHNLFLKFR